MDDLKIVVPTHGRAGRVDTLGLVPEAILCVAESQAAAYRAAYPKAAIDVHPDSVVGLAAKRNWMYERYGSMFTMDDDMLKMLDVSRQPGDPVEVPRERVVPVIHRTAENCHELGAYVFGFNQMPNPMRFSPQQPFALTGLVIGGATGLLAGSGLWWHPECLQDDFWLMLLNAHFHRKVWIDLRYCITMRPLGINPGGQGHQRTVARQQVGMRILQRAFGSAVSVNHSHGFGKMMEDAIPDVKLPY